MNSDYSEYQAGFRSCLAGVNQYLLKADMGRSNQSDMLTQLSSRLLRPDARDEGSSTADSDPKNGQSTDLTEQRLAANMALQASPVAVSNCVRGSANIKRKHGNAVKTTEFTGKVSFPGVPEIGVISAREQKESCSTGYSSRSSNSTDGQHNEKYVLAPSDSHWRPW